MGGGYPKVSEDPPQGHWTAERYCHDGGFRARPGCSSIPSCQPLLACTVVSSDIDHPHDWGLEGRSQLQIETWASMEEPLKPQALQLGPIPDDVSGVAENLLPIQHCTIWAVQHEPHWHTLT
jgi:hypothetical protein